MADCDVQLSEDEADASDDNCLDDVLFSRKQAQAHVQSGCPSILGCPRITKVTRVAMITVTLLTLTNPVLRIQTVYINHDNNYHVNVTSNNNTTNNYKDENEQTNGSDKIKDHRYKEHC